MYTGVPLFLDRTLALVTRASKAAAKPDYLSGIPLYKRMLRYSVASVRGLVKLATARALKISGRRNRQVLNKSCSLDVEIDLVILSNVYTITSATAGGKTRETNIKI